MSGKELVKRNHNAMIVKEQVALPFSLITYECKEDSYYFSKTIDGERYIEWQETEQDYENSEFIDTDFCAEVPDTKKEYYFVAAASGLLTATLSSLRLSDLVKLKDELTEKDFKKYIIFAAKAMGYKKSDYKGAVRFIKGLATQFVDSSIPSSTRVYLRDLASNSKLVGLVFSIIAQFTGKKYQIGDDGDMTYREIPDYYIIGDTPAEKIFYGFLYWVFALAVDSAVQKKNVINELKFPKVLLTVLESILDTPLMSKMPKNIEEAERLYSQWIEKWFEESTIMEIDGSTVAFNLVHMIKAISVEAIEESVPVLLNECLFRGFYFLRRLSLELKAKNISRFDELYLVDPHDILPFNNQVVSRMAVIASGVFVAADLGCAALRVLVDKQKRENKSFGKALLAEANIAGIGRFVLAIGADSKYWVEEFRVLFVRKSKDAEIQLERLLGKDSKTSDVYSELSLNRKQAQLLYSLESFAVMDDIRQTEDEKKKELKKQWLKEWQNQIVFGLHYKGNDFFVENETEIYQRLREQLATSTDLKWFHLLSVEFALFSAYYPIGTENDVDYRKLKYDEKHSEDRFLNKQYYVSDEEWKNIKSHYKKHFDIISGHRKKVLIGVGISTVVLGAAGGLAFALAPQIAVMLAGGAFAGLHGVALTNASLALIGGGALAVGGGGMAAGTAIITGGGVLLGAAGSGSATFIAMMAQADPGIWAEQGAKLATFCSAVLHDVYHNKGISRILYETDEAIRAVQKMITDIEKDETELDKELLKMLKQYQTYLERTEKQIHKCLS